MGGVQTEWTSFFAKLIRDFLIASNAATTGIPVNATLPKVMQDETAKVARPCVVVTGVQEESEISRLVKIKVTVELKTMTGPDSALPVTAAEWMAAIETRLRDVVGFYTWVAALAQSRRENWMFVKAPRVGVVELEVDEEAHTQSRMLGVQLSVFTERPV